MTVWVLGGEPQPGSPAWLPALPPRPHPPWARTSAFDLQPSVGLGVRESGSPGPRSPPPAPGPEGWLRRRWSPPRLRAGPWGSPRGAGAEAPAGSVLLDILAGDSM